MLEQNKATFRLLLLASGALLLAQTVLLIVFGDGNEMRIAMPLIFILSEVATCALICFCILHPQYNRNYTLRRRDGRWKWERVTYGPDPNGMRYISSGVCTLLIALIFVVISAAVLWPQVVTETVSIIISCALVIILCIIFSVIENKLRK